MSRHIFLNQYGRLFVVGVALGTGYEIGRTLPYVLVKTIKKHPIRRIKAAWNEAE